MVNKLNEFKYLQTVVYAKLSDERIPFHIRQELQDIFLSRFKRMLKLCFTINVDSDEFIRFTNSMGVNNPEANLKFMAKYVENETSYDLFIELFRKTIEIINSELEI